VRAADFAAHVENKMPRSKTHDCATVAASDYTDAASSQFMRIT
jgi:hypothetical protein